VLMSCWLVQLCPAASCITSYGKGLLIERNMLHLQVSDPSGGVVHENKAQHQGQFAFTTKAAGEYQACFNTHGKHSRTNRTMYMRHEAWFGNRSSRCWGARHPWHACSCLQ
jgi:hypothetical protein